MKLGLNTYSYHHAAGLWDYVPRANAPMTIDHFLRKAVELGLDGVHLCDPRHLESLEYGYVSELRDKVESAGLYLELGTVGTNPDHLQSMVRTAHVLGSRIVRTMLGKPRPHSASAMFRILEQTATEISQVVPVCQRYRVSLAIENSPEVTTEELLGLLDRVGGDWVGVSFDTGCPLAVLEDPLEAATALAGSIRVIQLRDYQLEQRPDGFALVGCALGEGVVDLRGVVDLLASRSAEANLNLAACVERRIVPALEDDYLALLPGKQARALGRTLRLVRDRGRRQAVLPAAEREASEEEVLAQEDEVVVLSARWAQQALGRPAAELPDSSE